RGPPPREPGPLRRPPLRAPSRHLGGGGLLLARALAPRRRGGHLPADHRRRQRPSDRRGRGGAGASGRHRGAPAGVAPADTRQRIGLRHPPPTGRARGRLRPDPFPHRRLHGGGDPVGRPPPPRDDVRGRRGRRGRRPGGGSQRRIAERLAERPVGPVGRLANAVYDELVAGVRSRVGPDLAERLGVSQRTIQRALKETLGHGPKFLSRRIRLQELARLLVTEPDLDLATLAFELGYADQAHLTNDFRSVTGMSPGSYRREVMSLTARR